MPDGTEMDRSKNPDETFGDFFLDHSFFSQEETDAEHVNVNHFWNMASFLPDMCREIFQTVVGSYVFEANKLFHDYYKQNNGEVMANQQFEDQEEEERPAIEPIRILRIKIETDLTDVMLT